MSNGTKKRLVRLSNGKRSSYQQTLLLMESPKVILCFAAFTSAAVSTMLTHVIVSAADFDISCRTCLQQLMRLPSHVFQREVPSIQDTRATRGGMSANFQRRVNFISAEVDGCHRFLSGQCANLKMFHLCGFTISDTILQSSA